MRFVNRIKELGAIKEGANLSQNKLYSMVLYGLRRVGKTRLVLESIKSSDIYFFVNKDKSSQSLLDEFEETLRLRNIITQYEKVGNWDNFFRILIERYKGIIAFDEFQNFAAVDTSVYGIIQKYLDLNEQKKGILFIFLGSTIGMIKKIFEDKKEPLYGRVKRRLSLQPLEFFDAAKLCHELKIKDIEHIIVLYSIFGGFPKYYVAIEDENLFDKDYKSIIQKLFFSDNAVLEEESYLILSLEFGKRKGIYYDILTAIARGNTKPSEISSYLNKKETLFSRHLNELIHYFEIVVQQQQAIGNKKILKIKHPLLNFWFSMFYKRLTMYKSRDKEFMKKVIDSIPQYVGGQFEIICSEILGKITNYKKIAPQWGKFRGEKGKNTYEIDICGVNDDTKEILFAECKWKDKVDASKVLLDLREKSKHVQWNNDSRKEQYAIFAKSFKDKNVKGVKLYDLKDIEKMLK